MRLEGGVQVAGLLFGARHTGVPLASTASVRRRFTAAQIAAVFTGTAPVRSWSCTAVPHCCPAPRRRPGPVRADRLARASYR